MIMNYVLSFCKITGASKIFSRNFYLPLLKPITPKDALRTFKITGKWLLGSKIQHYIPVLFKHKQKRSKKLKNYGKIEHNETDNYTYIMPIFDPENENHRILQEILTSKSGEGAFVYTIDGKNYNLVIDAPLELAIRDGDIIDVLVSQRSDKVIFKLKDFKKIRLETQHYKGEEKLLRGEGATTEEEEKFHHHGKNTMSLAKVFEDKERDAEEWELEMQRLIQSRRRQPGEGTREWNDMVKATTENFDWDKHENDVKFVIDHVNEPVCEQHIGMEIEDFEKTKNVAEIFVNNEFLAQLPTMKEIADLVKCMQTASIHEIEEIHEDPLKRRRVSGVKVQLSSGKECFVTGQMVTTDDGDVFVPGQTIENSFGQEYAPGITINMNNKPTLITGIIVGEENEEPMFVPAESSITEDGQLTFTTRPEERTKLKKKKKKNKKVKSTAPLETIVVVEDIEINPIAEEEMEEEQVKEEEEEEEIRLVEEAEEIEQTENDSAEKDEPERYDDEYILEMERLRQRLNDSMDEVLTSIELKKLGIKQKLEELRKLTANAEDNSVTYVNVSNAREIASNITDSLENIHKIADTLLTITIRVANFPDKNNINVENIHNKDMIYSSSCKSETFEKFATCSEKIKITLKAAIVAANDVFKKRPKDQVTGLNAIGEIMKECLKDKNNLIDELSRLMNTQADRNDICTVILKDLTQTPKTSKTKLLQSLIVNHEDTETVTETIGSILDDEALFKKVARTAPEIVEEILNILQDRKDEIEVDSNAVKILQSAVAKSVVKVTEQNLQNFLRSSDDYEINELITEAAGFAKVIGLEEIELNIFQILNDTKSLGVLKRVMVLRLLAESDYGLKTALKRLQRNPESSKTDPRIRQLIRESAALISNGTSIKNSRDIPLEMMKTQNILGLEDFLIQRGKIVIPVLISRRGMQAVVPKEAEKGVLAGRIPYILIDESGITSLKPAKDFSALKIKSRFGDEWSSTGKQFPVAPNVRNSMTA